MKALPPGNPKRYIKRGANIGVLFPQDKLKLEKLKNLAVALRHKQPRLAKEINTVLKNHGY